MNLMATLGLSARQWDGLRMIQGLSALLPSYARIKPRVKQLKHQFLMKELRLPFELVSKVTPLSGSSETATKIEKSEIQLAYSTTGMVPAERLETAVEMGIDLVDVMPSRQQEALAIKELRTVRPAHPLRPRRLVRSVMLALTTCKTDAWKPRRACATRSVRLPNA
jgi:hypothetical protein